MPCTGRLVSTTWAPVGRPADGPACVLRRSIGSAGTHVPRDMPISLPPRGPAGEFSTSNYRTSILLPPVEPAPDRFVAGHRPWSGPRRAWAAHCGTWTSWTARRETNGNKDKKRTRRSARTLAGIRRLCRRNPPAQLTPTPANDRNHPAPRGYPASLYTPRLTRWKRSSVSSVLATMA